VNLTVVITTMASLDAMAGLLPGQPVAVVRSARHVYRLYRLRVVERCADYAFKDPIDGEVLVSCRHFDNESAARTWVAADIALQAAAP